MTNGPTEVEKRLAAQILAGADEIDESADAKDRRADDLEVEMRELRAEAAADRQRARRLRGQAERLAPPQSTTRRAVAARAPRNARTAARKRPLKGKRRALAERLVAVAPAPVTSRELLEWYDATRAERGEPPAGPYPTPEDLEAALARLEDPLWYLRAQGLAERVAPRTWRWRDGAEMP
jgi:hypothetical protein